MSPLSPMSPPGPGAAPRLLLALLCLTPPTTAPPVPPSAAPAPRSAAPPVLSLNLGLNFQIKMRSQNPPRPLPTKDPPPSPPPSTPTPPPSGSGWPDPEDEPGSGTPPEESGGWGGDKPTPPGPPHAKELELDIAIDLSAGLEPEAGEGAAGGSMPPPTLLRGPPRPPLSLLPGIAELIEKIGTAGFLVPPRVDNGTQELELGGSGAEPDPPSGREPSRGGVAPPPAAASACTPGSTCTSGGPDPRGAGGSDPPAFPWPPHLVSLGTSWAVAAAAWGPAWAAHVYGAAALFAFLALLGALVLLGGRRPPTARVLGGLLAAAGAARAFPLFYDPYERGGRLPPPAARLLFELPFPCLGWGLALGAPLLGPPPRCPASPVAVLGVLHAGGVLGAVLGGGALPRWPWLLLVPRGLFVTLVVALAIGGVTRCPRAKGGAGVAGRRAALGVAGVGALASAGLQVFGVLQGLGWRGTPPPGPWGWWGLQLGCRVAEVTVGLPLAALALAAPPPSHGDPPGDPPNGCTRRGGSEVAALSGGPHDGTDGDGDPTAGYRPPSPIDLRRSIAEALGGGRGIFRGDTGNGDTATKIGGIGTTGIFRGDTGVGTTSIGDAEIGTNGIGDTGIGGISTTGTGGISTTDTGGIGTGGIGTTGTGGISTTGTGGIGTGGIGTTGTGGISTGGIGTTGTGGIGTTGINDTGTGTGGADTSATRCLGTAGTAAVGTTSATGVGTTDTLSPGTTGTPGIGTTSVTGLGVTGTAGISKTGTRGPGTTTAPSVGATGASGFGTTGTSRIGTTSSPGLSTTSSPGPGTTSSPGLSTTSSPGPGTTSTAGSGTTSSPGPGTTGTFELGTTSPAAPGTTDSAGPATPTPPNRGRPAPPGPAPPGSPPFPHRVTSRAGGSPLSPGGGHSPSPQGLSRGGPVAVPKRSPPPSLRPSHSWTEGGGPRTTPDPQPRGGAVPAVSEPPGDTGTDRRSLGSDTIDL